MGLRFSHHCISFLFTFYFPVFLELGLLFVVFKPLLFNLCRFSLSLFCPHRPKDYDRKTQEQILCDQETFYCRPTANHHQLSRVQPPRQRVLQVCQHLRKIFLLQIKRRRSDWEMKPASELFRLTRSYFHSGQTPR